ncbi:MAG: hypothetical protein ACRECR_01610, partial [Thermoplasmata archaeon]
MNSPISVGDPEEPSPGGRPPPPGADPGSDSPGLAPVGPAESAGRYLRARWEGFFSRTPARRRLGRSLLRYGPICGVALLVVALRLPVLLSHPYPPGSDIAEETFWTHLWLGRTFAGAPSALSVPPLYLFAVLAPLLAVLPVFTAGIATDLVVSALVVFPAYLLFRRVPLRPGFALLGSFLFGSSAAFSSMITWNGGYNLFGIAMLTFFLAFLLEALETGSRGPALFAGISFGLVAASNFLSLFIGVVLLGVLVPLLLASEARWRLLRSWAKVVGFSLLAALPSVPVYYVLTRGLSNTTSSPWELTGSQIALLTLSTPWGGLTNGVALTIAGIGTALGVLGIAALALRAPTRRTAAVLFALAVASYVAALADPGNFSRGYFYLPAVFLPAALFLFQAIHDGIP